MAGGALVWEYDGSGTAIASADVTGDGHPDVVIGVSSAPAGGKVEVYSITAAP